MRVDLDRLNLNLFCATLQARNNKTKQDSTLKHRGWHQNKFFTRNTLCVYAKEKTVVSPSLNKGLAVRFSKYLEKVIEFLFNFGKYFMCKRQPLALKKNFLKGSEDSQKLYLGK